MLQSFKFVSPDLYWDFSHVILCCRAVLIWLRSKKVSLFQFCDLKTNLHIRVHPFPCHKVSNLYPLIFIEILAMSYFVVGQSWFDWGQRKWVYFSFVILKLICIFGFMLFHAVNVKFVSPNLYWEFSHVVLSHRAVLTWLRSKKVSYFNFTSKAQFAYSKGRAEKLWAH
jgi:hypothetical protein